MKVSYPYFDEMVTKEFLQLLERKKIEIMLTQTRQRAKAKDFDISGVVVADKIAEGMISGVVTEPVTPKKGKEMSDNIKRKYFQNRRQNG